MLGIDPGSRVTGWGLVSGTVQRPRLLDCGTIVLGVEPDLPARLARLQRDLAQLVQALGVSCAAVESPFHGKDARAALQLAHARGVILAGLAAAAIPVAEYTPATVKKAVTGNGRAPKDQVRRMVRLLVGGGRPPPPPPLLGAACRGMHRALAAATAPA